MTLSYLIQHSRQAVAYAFRVVSALYVAITVLAAMQDRLSWLEILLNLSLAYLFFYAGGLASALYRAEREMRMLLSLSAPRLAPRQEGFRH